MEDLKEIRKLVKGKELIVRKHLVNFFQKLLVFTGYDNNHDVFKKVVYSEGCYMTPLEKDIKCYYDALMYLVNNKKSLINSELLKRFFYIFLGKEIEEEIILKIKTNFFHLKDLSSIGQAIEFHLYIYELLSELSDQERFLISMFFLNFTLISNEIPGIQLHNQELERYVEVRKSYFNNNKADMYLFLVEIIRKQKFQEKYYHANLEYLDEKEVYKILKSHEEDFKIMYGVKTLFIFGSFAKEKVRKDSDIDIVVSLSQDLLYEEKLKIKQAMAIYLYAKFKRFVDIHDVDEYLTDEFIKSASCMKKVF